MLSTEIFKLIAIFRDGYNLAFIFNSSLGQEGGTCRQGLACLVEELVQVRQGHQSRLCHALSHPRTWLKALTRR